MTVRMGPDGKLVYIANYLLNAIQVVDPARRAVVSNNFPGWAGRAVIGPPRRGDFL